MSFLFKFVLIIHSFEESRKEREYTPNEFIKISKNVTPYLFFAKYNRKEDNYNFKLYRMVINTSA